MVNFRFSLNLELQSGIRLLDLLDQPTNRFPVKGFISNAKGIAMGTVIESNKVDFGEVRICQSIAQKSHGDDYNHWIHS